MKDSTLKTLAIWIPAVGGLTAGALLQQYPYDNKQVLNCLSIIAIGSGIVLSVLINFALSGGKFSMPENRHTKMMRERLGEEPPEEDEE